MAEMNYTPPSASGMGQGMYSDDEMPPSTSSYPGEMMMDTSVPTPHTTPLPSQPHSSLHRSPLTPSARSESLNEVLSFLRKHGLQEAEKTLVREATAKGLSDSLGPLPHSQQTTPEKQQGPTDIESLLAAHKSSANDPTMYVKDYEALIDLVENSLDRVKPELGALLFPVFAHMYLELISNNHLHAAETFRAKFSGVQESYWEEDIRRLARVSTQEHMDSNELIEAFRTQQYVLRVSKECLNCLKAFFTNHPLTTAIMRKHMNLEGTENAPRSKEAVDNMVGGILGEATKAANKSRISHGILKEPEMGAGDEGGGDEGKKKKAKGKEGARDKKKGDPNAPQFTRIPLPDLSEKMKSERKAGVKEWGKRLRLSPDHPPSICLYTLLNTAATGGVCCGDIGDDSSLLGVGYGNSTVQVFSLAAQKKLKPLKPLSELEKLDKEAASPKNLLASSSQNDDAKDIWVEMLDDKEERGNLLLTGHSGPVYSLSLSPDYRTLLSSSEDTTVRLWSLETWTNLVVYRAGAYPVWDVSFSSRGYYFVSGGADRMAMVWTTDRLQPLRIFSGHFSDVNSVRFHPNCNYVVSGSEDGSVRVWDILNGQSVRQLNGHSGGVQCVQWSPDGKYIASGGSDGRVIVWDVGQGKMMSASTPSLDALGSGVVNSLVFSRDSNVVAAGGMDNAVRLFHLPSLSVEAKSTDTPTSSVEPKLNAPGFQMGSFPTKATPLIHLHFTRKNLLMGLGSFDQ